MGTPRLGRITKINFPTRGSFPDVIVVSSIHGQSRTLGDPTDNSLIVTTADPGWLGWSGTTLANSERFFALLKIPTSVAAFGGNEVPRATLKLGFEAVGWTGTYAPVTIAFHGVRVSVDMAD